MDTSKTSKEDYRYSQRIDPNKRNLELEGDDGQNNRNPEQDHGPGLKSDTTPQPETERKTERDPDYENKTESDIEKKTSETKKSTDASTNAI